MTKGTVKMRAPRGTDEANVGADLYRVDNSGEIEVPEDAVATLTGAGFVADLPAPAPPNGRLKMKAPDGATSCSFGAASFAVGADGMLEVPAEAVADLMSHGYVPVEG